MLISVRQLDAKYRLTHGGYWHHWFAWHPVKIANAYLWLETVMRKRKCEVLDDPLHTGAFTLTTTTYKRIPKC